jgi:hypothetical protein
VDADALSLTVGEGVSGILEYDATAARTLTVSTNVTIAAGGIFRSATTGTETGHQLSVGGNLTNNGTLNFSTNGNTAGAVIIFIGAANASFNGTGTTTDVLAITIDKGVDPTSILELSTDAFTFQGSNITGTDVPSFLDVLNGTFKISGTFTMNNCLFTGAGAYTIPETGGVWLNNPNFTVEARSGTANVDGLLQVDAGTYNIGTAQGHRLGYIAGTVVNINGGTVNVASRMSPTSTFGITYTQTGGTINLNTVANTSTVRASFDIVDNDNSTFTMSGGTIALQNASTTGSGPRDYSNFATNVNITGGTLQVGNALSGSAQTYFLSGSAPGLVIDNTVAGHTVKLFDNLIVAGNTTINPSTTLTLDDGATGFVFTQQGTTFTNAGTLDGTVAASRLLFAGTAAQSYGGDGILTSPIASLQFNNASGVSITNTIASDITTNLLLMTAGDIIAGVSTITVGTSDVSVGAVIYVSGTIVGKLKRWIGTTTGLRNFRIGIPGSTRTAGIDFTTAVTTGGTLTAEWISVPGGSNGMPLTDGAITVTKTSFDGYWSVVAGDGLSGGIYDGTFTATDITDVTDFSQLVLVKRADNVSPWTLDGTHVTTTGSNTTPVLSRTGMSGFSEFGIGGSITSLPITIQYFKGSKQNSGNLLEWKVTCTNSPSATMLLERSADGRIFYPVHSITATALRCLQPFNYTDGSPKAGINYYRLKTVDIDGRGTNSNILAILNKEKGFDIVSVMPNPVKDIAVLSVASATASKMEIVITDISGKQVSKQTVSLIAGSNQVPLDFKNLSNGAYQVTGYTLDGQAKTLQFIKN